MLAASISPTNPGPVHPEPITKPSPQQLGDAYRAVLAVQEATYQEISADHRRLYDAYGRLAASADPSLARDRRILQQGARIVARQERGLVVARGVEQIDAYSEKIYVPLGIYTTLDALVKEDRTVGAGLVRSARRSTDAAVRELDALAVRLGGGALEGNSLNIQS